jgi:hypothetical protein
MVKSIQFLGEAKVHQLMPQSCSRPLQPPVHRRLANTEVFGQLPITPVLSVLEQQDFRVAARQSAKRLVDDLSPLFGNQQADRIGVLIRSRLSPLSRQRAAYRPKPRRWRARPRRNRRL